jgi:hypothetical protein
MITELFTHKLRLFLFFFAIFTLKQICWSQEEKVERHKFFETYSIPNELRQMPMQLFLEDVDRQTRVVLGGNCREVLRLFPENTTQWKWENATIKYTFVYDKETKQYHLLSYTTNIVKDSIDADNYNWQDVFDYTISFNSSGKMDQVFGAFWGFSYHDNGLLAEFSFSNKEMFPDVKTPSHIEWDENGNKTFDAYAEKRHNFWDDVWYDSNYLNDLRKKKTLTTHPNTRFEDLYRLPTKPSDKVVIAVLQGISNGYKNIRDGDVRKLLAIQGFDKHPTNDIYIDIALVKKHIGSVLCSQLLNEGRYACYMQFNEQEQLTTYRLGNLMKPTNQTNSIGLNTGNKMPHGIDGNGTEVKFHPTGYPASYKTIVKNRLFGRQIEWNDKGEVISDVDLDIPKPWADAPKKDDDSGQKK